MSRIMPSTRIKTSWCLWRHSRDESADDEYAIRLLSLASGKSHPSAVRPFLPSVPPTQRDFIIRISGDFICVWLEYDVTEHIATIWNWVSGDQRLRISGFPSHCVLLPTGHLLVASRGPSPHIAVHDLHHNSPELPSHTFDFPPTYVAARVHIGELASSEVPTWRLSTQFAGPFSMSPNSNLLFISLSCGVPKLAPLIQKVMCIIPASTLMRYTQSDDVDVGASVPWATWGKDLLLPPSPIKGCPTRFGMKFPTRFGMKAVRTNLLSPTTGATDITIYDFNQIRFKPSECATRLDDADGNLYDEYREYPRGALGVFSSLRLPPFTKRIVRYRSGRRSGLSTPYFTEDGILLAYDNWPAGMAPPFVLHLEMLYF
ncbi:hypothetical protein JAAARDRAFT_201500 [Jaapia argillacea MUCL 33604]|uniref:F-box domain-containing protein n=1 Tax=Jaapia argillacea MUCL 33604 TaxID=933084 RepID=A0A067QN85_9AGAM|nr:hypothetical protein JAAARDRAFT_201500 [Jaapia argillacea MUCL 33604]